MALIYAACVFLCSFCFLREITAHEVERRASDSDEWLKVKKSDLCPALSKEAFCTGDGIDIDEIVKAIDSIEDSTAIPLPRGSADWGKKSSKCTEPLRKALCSSSKPLCLVDKKDAGTSAAGKVCKDMYDTCPALAGEKSLEQYTKQCEEYLVRKYSDMTCESVGSKYEDGVCQRPTRKIPAFYIPVYELKSKSLKGIADVLDSGNKLLGDEALSASCMTTIKETMCLPIYCSDTDDGVVEIKNKQKDCTRAMECLAKALDKTPTAGLDLAKTALKEVKKFVSESCDNLVETFEEIVAESNESKKNHSPAKALSAPVLLLLVSVLLKNLL